MIRTMLSLVVLAVVTSLTARSSGSKPDDSPCTATCGLCGGTCRGKGAHSAHFCKVCGHGWHD